MPPDATQKEMEEIVEAICDFDFENKLWSDKGFDEFKDLIRTALTQYHQDLMREVVKELEGMKKNTDKYFAVDNKRTGEKRYTGKGQCRSCMQFKDIEETSYNQALTEAQNIIKLSK